eukprot:g23897.t1
MWWVFLHLLPFSHSTSIRSQALILPLPEGPATYAVQADLLQAVQSLRGEVQESQQHKGQERDNHGEIQVQKEEQVIEEAEKDKANVDEGEDMDLMDLETAKALYKASDVTSPKHEYDLLCELLQEIGYDGLSHDIPSAKIVDQVEGKAKVNFIFGTTLSPLQQDLLKAQKEAQQDVDFSSLPFPDQLYYKLHNLFGDSETLLTLEWPGRVLNEKSFAYQIKDSYTSYLKP